jgi:hypothetical protein
MDILTTPQIERTDLAQMEFDFTMDNYDDEPLACGIEDPDICDSCQ